MSGIILAKLAKLGVGVCSLRRGQDMYPGVPPAPSIPSRPFSSKQYRSTRKLQLHLVSTHYFECSDSGQSDIDPIIDALSLNSPGVSQVSLPKNGRIKYLFPCVAGPGWIRRLHSIPTVLTLDSKTFPPPPFFAFQGLGSDSFPPLCHISKA